MSAKSTVSQYVVTPANVQANVNAALYVANQMEILATATTVATALLVAGEPQGAPVLAIVPVIQSQVTEFPPELAAATAIAQAPFA